MFLENHLLVDVAVHFKQVSKQSANGRQYMLYVLISEGDCKWICID